MNQNVIRGVSTVKSSEYRRKILESLLDVQFITPSEIAKKTKIRLNHVSNFLKDLKDANLVKCLNPEQKRGRLYQITGLGKEVLKYVSSKPK